MNKFILFDEIQSTPVYFKETEKAVLLQIHIDDFNLERDIRRLVWVPKSQLAENGAPSYWITTEKAKDLISDRDCHINWEDAEQNAFSPSPNARERAADERRQNAFEKGQNAYNQLLEKAKALGIKGVRVGWKKATIEKKIQEYLNYKICEGV